MYVSIYINTCMYRRPIPFFGEAKTGQYTEGRKGGGGKTKNLKHMVARVPDDGAV